MSIKRVYDPAKIEAKWGQSWLENRANVTDEKSEKSKSYVLGMFPYPSGAGLHTGHVRIFTATDVLARYQRMRGYKVLFPMGWDAFGLPAENAAIKTKTNPKEMVPKNEANFRRQMQMMGLSYDWDREFSTTDPEFYKWTQWLFLKLYSIKNEKGERLVYRTKVPINWCPNCKTGLANEEVLGDGTHERCGTKVEQKLLPQWVMRITDYADRLLSDLDGLDWPKGILEMQRNWIGRKEGVKVKFSLRNVPGQEDDKHEVEVFTSRLDTIFGVSFLVVAPELVKKWLEVGFKASDEVKKYVEAALDRSELERKEGEKEKTGVDMGIKAVNPVNGEEVPVYVADYVLMEVGTGAVMGVPAHDGRDQAFAKKHNLKIKEVVEGESIDELMDQDGVLKNSQEYDGLSSKEAREKIMTDLGDMASKMVNYHLRDWVFSRQRYWGEPFPLVYCDKCGDENGVVPIPESQLPVELPDLESYEPTDTGESPLVKVKDWVETKCPVCGGKAKRETDTMPNWAGSCWYFLRFADPKNMDEAWSEERLASWLPVDWYLGGAEHAVLHLLYARFWVKAFYDLGLLKFKEPFIRLRSVGLVLAEDGRKMSKSLGNIVSPDDVVQRFGADAVRIYEMFMGPWEQAISWQSRSLVGGYRFLEKVWKLALMSIKEDVKESDSELRASLQRVIKKVGEDIEAVKFNTAIAALMEFSNEWSKRKELSRADLKKLIQVLAPFAPFMAEELWQEMGGKESIHLSSWPKYEEVKESTVTIPVQVNGKVRTTLLVSVADALEEDKVVALALEDEAVSKWIGESEYRVVFVPGRMVSFVLK